MCGRGSRFGSVKAVPNQTELDPGTDNREIRGKQAIGENGWRSSSVWRSYGHTGRDDSVGAEYISYYEMDGTDWRCEVEFIVVADKVEEGEDPSYGVEEHSVVFREADGDQLDREDSYEGGSYLSYSTIEAAEKEARRLAMNDTSWTFANKADSAWN